MAAACKPLYLPLETAAALASSSFKHSASSATAFLCSLAEAAKSAGLLSRLASALCLVASLCLAVHCWLSCFPLALPDASLAKSSRKKTTKMIKGSIVQEGCALDESLEAELETAGGPTPTARGPGDRTCPCKCVLPTCPRKAEGRTRILGCFPIAELAERIEVTPRQFDMGCPWLGDVVDSAINRCPFLNSVKAANGEAFARTLAMNPGNKVREPIFPESLSDFKASFHLFHGANGVVPLARCDDLPAPETSSKDASQARGCPFQGQQAARQPAAEAESGHGVAALHSGGSRGHPLEAAPFASLTTRVFRFLPGPEEFIARRRKRRQERRDRRADRQRQGRGKPGTQAKQSGLEKWRAHPVVGGLLPLNAAGKYVCPPLVVAGRAAVAQLRTTKFLRPQALPLKLLGVGAHCLVANVPCGAVREHTRKFSPAWFLAVHATVPFFAFMRKGVGMPRWAIVLTLAAAVAGQAIGARLERARLQWAMEGREEACPVLKSCSQVGKGVMAEAPLAPLVVA